MIHVFIKPNVLSNTVLYCDLFNMLLRITATISRSFDNYLCDMNEGFESLGTRKK